MSASSSRPTSSPRSSTATTSGNRKKHGRRRAHGLDDAAAVAPSDLSPLHTAIDASAGGWPCSGAALGGRLPAVLSSVLLLHPRIARAADRAADGDASGLVCRQPRLLSRHHDFWLADCRFLYRQRRGRALTAVRLARETAALCFYQPAGTQHGRPARQHRRAA